MPKPKPRPRGHDNGSARPRAFVFADRATGAARFLVEATREGSLPVEPAASLLAFHCLARGATPEDFEVLVRTDKDLLAPVAGAARRLLKTQWPGPGPVALSRRQREVLQGVVQDLANKEIAARLNLSERTVKFHVSALLSKFRVRGRAGLAREAAQALPQLAPSASAGRRTAPPPDARAGERVTVLPARRLA